MSDPPLSDIDFKNKIAWVWTTLKGRVLNSKIWSFKGTVFCLKNEIKVRVLAENFEILNSEIFR